MKVSEMILTFKSQTELLAALHRLGCFMPQSVYSAGVRHQICFRSLEEHDRAKQILKGDLCPKITS